MQSSLGKCHLCWWRFASLAGVSFGEMLCSSRMFNKLCDCVLEARPDSKFSLVQPTSWMSPRKRWLGCELVWFCTFAIGLQISCTTNLAVVLFLPHGSSSHRKPCSDVVFQVGEKRGCPVDLTTEVSKVGSMLTVSGKIHPNSCGFFAVGKSSSIRGLPIGATLSEALSTRWLSGWLVVAGCCVEKTVSTCWNNAGCCVFMIFWMRRCARTSCIGSVCRPGELFSSLQWWLMRWKTVLPRIWFKVRQKWKRH